MLIARKAGFDPKLKLTPIDRIDMIESIIWLIGWMAAWYARNWLNEDYSACVIDWSIRWLGLTKACIVGGQ